MNERPSPGSHIHMIAICGVGMASLAGLLQSQGYRVTGSDQNIYPPMSTYLADIGIEVMPGFHPEHFLIRPDLVIVGNAVSRDNPEAQAVLNQKIPFISFPQALGLFLIGERESLVVAGTHGKTTTTALAAWVLTRAGLDPGFFVGGVPLNFGSGWGSGKGNHVVIEGDEYDTAFFDKGPKFLHYRPRQVILTSVEFDHADIYRDLDHVKASFKRLMKIIPKDGCLVVCNDYPAAMEMAGESQSPVIVYGDGNGADWTLTNVRIRAGKSFFEPCYRGKSEGAIEALIIGQHNIKNALAVYAMARAMGIERGQLLDGFATFAGVKRRQELKGEGRGVLVIDDFAHHPTAVGATIDAVKEAYPGRRLWALFEPRSNTSRRRIFEREFAEALSRADRVLLTGLYQPDKIVEQERMSVAAVAQEVNRLNPAARAVVVEKSQDSAAFVAQKAAPGDIVLVMSNGAFDGVQEKILAALAG
ncbi:MAG TPA: UDP-N-acetylmuramate:L-alanyl-gamma-D-glutamyl-meso-diaminopimelate ligase [Candidatus Acidoferrales bacterium]|nr:UDP-N-acetylmuramate:L-alanyl-gamma-D-glutamyl-meso-diaminopimelate ligase [Candidatus Acidoferrales bacterium]